MPAMGMASMRTPVTLSDKGNGLYEGSGHADSGGNMESPTTSQRMATHRE